MKKALKILLLTPGMGEQVETFYLLDESGNRITDGSGNRITVEEP